MSSKGSSHCEKSGRPMALTESPARAGSPSRALTGVSNAGVAIDAAGVLRHRVVQDPRGLLPGELNHTHYIPRGVAAVISPWNFPLAIPCGMTAAAIVAVLEAALLMVVALGWVKLDEGQLAGVMAFILAFVALGVPLVGVLWARSKVSPVSDE